MSGKADSITGHTAVRLADYTDEILRSGFPRLRHVSGRALGTQLASYLDRIVDRDFPELGHEDLLDSVVIVTGTDAYRRKDGIAVVPAALLGP